MIELASRAENREPKSLALGAKKPLSFLRFLFRYSIFLLAVGPPIFRPPIVGADASKAHFDIWNVVQVGWIAIIALRAVLRLISVRSIRIPKRVRSILKLAFLIGLLFLTSVAYSPGRVVSAEFGILYFLTFIVVVEFIVDTYREPPDWYQCMFHLRTVSLAMLAVVLMTIPFAPALVMSIDPGVGIRLIGGAVGSPSVFCPIIAIISTYNFLHSLEPRPQAFFFFLIGLAGTLIVQSRGTDIALFLVLAMLFVGWARTSRRAIYTAIAAVLASTIMASALVATVGADRLWSRFNRGQDTEEIASASGRTEIWKFAIQYSMTHPQGMGYVAGFRSLFTHNFDPVLGAGVARLGTTHNAFMQYLVDGGWLGMVFYLMLLAKLIVLGWHYARDNYRLKLASERSAVHTIRCALLLLAYCLADGMDSSTFTIPLQQSFYYQNIIMAVILGTSAGMLYLDRQRHSMRGW